VPVQGVSLPVKLAGVVRGFPTLGGPGGGLIIDQAALQDALLQAGVQPPPVGEWWLRGPAGLRIHGLPVGTSVLHAAAVAAGLRAQPLGAAGLEELLAVAIAALVLAGAGFAVSVAAGRDRDGDAAVLDALGARRAQLTTLFSLEQAMLAIPAAAAGLLLGTLLSHLIIPAVTLTAEAARPVPAAAVLVPVLPAIAVAAAIAAIPPLAAALSGLRRMRAAAALRAGAQT
jgi:FtsX-like permease family